jgi:hypothetical protein
LFCELQGRNLHLLEEDGHVGHRAGTGRDFVLGHARSLHQVVDAGGEWKSPEAALAIMWDRIS